MGYFIYPFHLSFMHDIEFYHHCEVLSYVSPPIISFKQFQISALFDGCSHLHCHCPGETKQIKKTPRRLWIESDTFNSSPTCQCTNLLPMVHPNKLSCSVWIYFCLKGGYIRNWIAAYVRSWNIGAIFVTASNFQLTPHSWYCFPLRYKDNQAVYINGNWYMANTKRLSSLTTLHWVKTTLSWRVTVSVDSWTFSMIFMQWF